MQAGGSVSSTGGTSPTGGSSGTMGGRSGTIGAEQLGSSCSSPGGLACTGHHQKLKLVCSGSNEWESNGTCEQGDFCQTAPGADLGTCIAEAEECRGEAPGALVCRATELRRCGVDALDSELVEGCTFGCTAGKCDETATCESGFADCDDNPDCETNTATSAQHCGACSHACAGLPNTSGYCEASQCACAPNYADCTDAPGCETPSENDPENCGACGNTCTSGACAGGHCVTRVFLTSEEYSGDLGGLAGGDEKCQALADAANLGGQFKAWLRDSKIDIADRLPHSSGPYRLLNGTTVADNWQGLGNVKAAIKVDESATVLSSSYVRVWTGVNPGLPEVNQCNDWSSDDSALDRGFIAIVGSGIAWQSSSAMECQNGRARLYCFEIVNE